MQADKRICENALAQCEQTEVSSSPTSLYGFVLGFTASSLNFASTSARSLDGGTDGAGTSPTATAKGSVISQVDSRGRPLRTSEQVLDERGLQLSDSQRRCCGGGS